jgi:hypothetical protein
MNENNPYAAPAAAGSTTSASQYQTAAQIMAGLALLHALWLAMNASIYFALVSNGAISAGAIVLALIGYVLCYSGLYANCRSGGNGWWRLLAASLLLILSLSQWRFGYSWVSPVLLGAALPLAGSMLAWLKRREAAAARGLA